MGGDGVHGGDGGAVRRRLGQKLVASTPGHAGHTAAGHHGGPARRHGCAVGAVAAWEDAVDRDVEGDVHGLAIAVLYAS